LLVEGAGSVVLLDPAVEHEGDAVGHADRLVLVVGNEEGRDADTALNLANQVAHLHPQRGIELGQRLIQQQDLGVHHESPRQGHPLLHPARQLAHGPIGQAR